MFLSPGTRIGRKRCIFYPGDIIQSVYAENSTYSGTLSGVIPYDNTIPLSGEGDQLLTATITPKSTKSKLRIRASGRMSTDAVAVFTVALFRDSTTDAVSATLGYVASGNLHFPFFLEHTETSNKLAPTTFKLRGGSTAGRVFYINGDAAVWTTGAGGGLLKTIIVIEEVAV